MTELTPDEVRKVARLSKLALDDAGVEDARVKLSAVLTHMEQLKTLDLAGVEPMPHVGEETNRLRDDEPGPTLPPKTVAALAPASFEAPDPNGDPSGESGEDGQPATVTFIKVPKVLGDGGGA